MTTEVLWMDRNAPRTGGQLDPNGAFDEYEDIELRVYLHADALGSVIAVSDKDRSGGSIDVIERCDYSAYGRRTTHTGAWACNGANCSYTTSVQDGPSLASLPMGYTGHYWDRETGLWYARNRYFDDRQGRFVSRDPLGLIAGANLYRYAAAMPMGLVDPLGLLGEGQQNMIDTQIERMSDYQDNAARQSVARASDRIQEDKLTWITDEVEITDWSDELGGPIELTAWGRYGSTNVHGDYFGLHDTWVGSDGLPWGRFGGMPDAGMRNSANGAKGFGVGLGFAVRFDSQLTVAGRLSFGYVGPLDVPLRKVNWSRLKNSWVRTFAIDPPHLGLPNGPFTTHFNAEAGPLRLFNHMKLPDVAHDLMRPTVVKGIARTAVVAGLALDTYSIVTASPEDRPEAIGSVVGGWGGAATGAMIGSMLLPGVGTIAGGVVGAIIGGWGGQEVGSWF